MTEAADIARYEALLARSLSQIASLKSRLREASARSEPVAVVGMACRFPGDGASPEAFARALEAGSCAVRELPPSRSLAPQGAELLVDELRFGGFLDETPSLDLDYFGISAREALTLDPQHRLLLELTREAFEDAGIDPRPHARETGVMLGIMHDDYRQRLLRGGHLDELDPHVVSGNGHSFACGRISYAFGFQGPCFSTDTACSSSLVAVHLACAALKRRECGLAVVGGANLILDLTSSSLIAKTGTLSRDGRCRPFDAGANGFVRGEGAGIVLLKRLSDAERDRDRIWAVIRGSAVNQNGEGAGLTAPNTEAQVELIRRALDDAQLPPERVVFVETHGTGTSLGDPIEVEALRVVYGRPSGPPCWLGAVKSYMGHLEAAAGIAGLIKAALVLRRQHVPKNLHFERLNPEIRLEGTRLAIPLQSEPLQSWEHPAAAGVSSFGLSGTNAHVILEAYRGGVEPSESSECGAGGEWPLLCVSAGSEESLGRLREAYVQRLEGLEDADFRRLRRAANVRRARLARRLVVRAGSREQALSELRGFRGARTSGELVGRGRVLVFSGHGSQWSGMGQELVRREPEFARALSSASECVSGFTGERVERLLEEASGLASWQLQPVLFALSVAYVALWRSYGYEPDAVIGHSVGEIAASYVCGGLSLEDAARVVCRRSALLREVIGHGGMTVVELTEEQGQAAVSKYGGRVSVGVVNGPRSLVLSGELSALRELEGTLSTQGVFVRRVNVDYASHSAQMDVLSQRLLAEFSCLRPQSPRVHFESTVGVGLTGVELFSPAYWVANLRETVQFSRGVERLLRSGHGSFVEVSPHPLLTLAIQEVGRAANIPLVVVSSSQREQDTLRVLSDSVAQLVAEHVELPLVRSDAPVPHLELPTTPWDHAIIPFPEVSSRPRKTSELEPVLGLADAQADRGFMLCLSLERLPELGDHRVDGEVLFPAAGWLELGLRVARSVNATCSALSAVRIGQALALSGSDEHLLQVGVRSSSQGLRLSFSSSTDAGATWHRHGEALALPGDAGSESSPRIAPMRAGRAIDAEAFYALQTHSGIAYGDSFRRIKGGRCEPGRGAVQVAWRSPGSSSALTDWASLDAALQAVGTALDNADARTETWVPVGCERLELLAPLRAEQMCEARVELREQQADKRLRADVEVVAADGSTALRLTGLSFEQLPRSSTERGERAFLHSAWSPLAEMSQDESRVTGDALAVVLEPGAAKHELAGCGALPISLPELREALTPAVSDVFVFVPRHASVEVAQLAQGLSDVAKAASTIADAGLRDTPRMWVVTRGAQRVTERGRVAPEQASYWGLLRTIGLEQPELRCSGLDLDPESSQSDELAALRALIARAPQPDQLALRNGALYAAELALGLPSAAVEAPALGNFALHAGSTGLSTLAFEVCPEERPRAGEVLVEPRAVGINFLDVLRASGAIDSAQIGLSSRLGTEAVCTVRSTGAGVTGFAPGQRVLALWPGVFARRVCVPAELVFPLQSAIGDAEASGFVVACATAFYALVRAARVQPGERVLVHAGSGAVGQSAIQWCRALGAQVFATASTPAKKELLRSLGVEHVFDSRSLSFVDDVLRATGDEGVDVVVNSLGGEALEASLSLLREGGRFIELGKRDYLANASIGLRPFLRRLRFELVDLLGMVHSRRAELVGVVTEVLGALAEGRIAPVPTTSFPAEAVGDAFTRMARAEHTGKLSVDLSRAPPSVKYRCSLGPVRADGCYLITGGLGGLGRILAQRLAEQGAGEVVLIGRKPGAAADLAAMRTRFGRTELFYEQCDVADGAALAAVFERATKRRCTPRGIFHAAAVLDDAMLRDLDAARAERVVRPKVMGALNLDALSREFPIDSFVLYSSAAALIGSPGQGAYAAANAFLDGLAARRLQEGLPALSVAWGPIGDVGLASEDALRGARLSGRGMASLSSKQTVVMLEALLGQAVAQVAVLKLDARQFAQYYPVVGGLHSFRNVLAGGGEAGHGGVATALRRQWEAADEAGRVGILEAWLRDEVANILRCAPERVREQQPFSSLGLDSLLGLELRNRVEVASNLKLSATALFAHANVAALARHLDRLLSAGVRSPSGVLPSAVTPTAEGSRDTDAAPTTTNDHSALLDELEALEQYLR